MFQAGLVVRLPLLFFLGSSYLTDLFIPFLDAWVQAPNANPWAHFDPKFFPYGSALFLVLAVPRWLGYQVFGHLALGTGPLGIALVKGPLLVLDLVLLVTLCRIAKRWGQVRQDHIVYFYWLNPILLYITYVHGQLDVAVMAFCMLALFAFARDRFIASAVWMALAILCKFHVVALIPFLFAFVWNGKFARDAIRTMATWSAVVVGLVIVGFLPVLLAGRFGYVSTSSPEAFRLFALQLSYGPGTPSLFLGLLLVLAVLGRLSLSTRITESGLMFGSATVFTALLLATYPSTGWLYWAVPFLALLHAVYSNVPRALFVALTLTYLLFYALLPFVRLEYPALLTAERDVLVSGVSFTLLLTVLGSYLLALFVYVLRFEAPLFKRVRPVLIGVAGDSASGKNTYALLMRDVFRARNTIAVEGDDYHRWERGDAAWEDYTPLDPRANELSRMRLHADQLSRGQRVYQREYDHATGAFTEPREIAATKVVVVQGLHTFYLRNLRDQFDLKVYLDPHPALRLAWKARRDTEERGHTREAVVAAMERRQHDSVSHIDPQRRFADWLIQYRPCQDAAPDAVLDAGSTDIYCRHVLWNDAPIEALVQALRSRAACEVAIEREPGEIDRVALVLRGAGATTPSADVITEVAREALGNLRHITRARQAPVFRAGYAGITQLVALALLSEPARGQHD